MYPVPSSVLMKMTLLQRLPHVALTCLAFFAWLLGWVITQHSTLTFFARSSATDLSSSLWAGSSLLCSRIDAMGCLSRSLADSLKSIIGLKKDAFSNHYVCVSKAKQFCWTAVSCLQCGGLHCSIYNGRFTIKNLIIYINALGGSHIQATVHGRLADR